MDSPRHESLRAMASASDADRDAKIEQLLLAGLDHYFAAQYEHAINVWTRVLFLDRSHARARAYIERARSAQAERQRELEERAASQAVVAAADVFRPDVPAEVERTRPERTLPEPEPVRRSRMRAASLAMAAIVILTLAGVAALNRFAPGQLATWRGVLQAGPAAALPPSSRDALIVPRRAELALERARALTAEGHLRDALMVLETVRATDPERAEADRLRGDIQRQLLALTAVPDGPGGRDDAAAGGDRRQR